MKNSSKVILTIIALVVVALILWFVTSRRTQEPHAELPVPELTKTARPHRMNFEIEANWIGTSYAKQEATIIALGEGNIVSVDANDEAAVSEGAALFTLGGAVLEAKLAAARERVSSLQNQLEVAKDTLTRKQEAVKEKISSLDELASAKSTAQQLDAELETAKGQWQLLDDSAHVTAPISGIFTGRKVSVGQTVEKGQELASIIVPGRVRIVATVLASGASGLEGRRVTFNAPDGRVLSGTVAKVLPERTAAGGTVVWIESKEIDEQVAPGQNLSGRVTVAVRESALAVLTSAVVYDEKEVAYAFVKVDDTFEQKQVQVGTTSGGWIEVISGLTSEEEVVTEGAYELYYRDFNKSYKVSD
jgi:RND family efflux transporter MFP subunit